MSNLNKNVTIETLNKKGKGFLPEFMGVEILELKENFIEKGFNKWQVNWK